MTTDRLIQMVREIVDPESHVEILGVDMTEPACAMLCVVHPLDKSLDPPTFSTALVTFDQDTVQSLTIVGADNVPTVRVQGGKRLG